jgi:hypothetical protein
MSRLAILEVQRYCHGLAKFALFVTISCFAIGEIEGCQLSVESCDCEVKSIRRLQDQTYLLTGIREEGTCFMLVSNGERRGYWDEFDFAGYNEKDGLTFLNRDGRWVQFPLIEVTGGGFGTEPGPGGGGEIDPYRLFLPTPVPRDHGLKIPFAKYLPSSDLWIVVAATPTQERWYRYSIKTKEFKRWELHGPLLEHIETEETEFIDFFDFVYRGEHPFVHILELDAEPNKLLLCHEFMFRYRCATFSVGQNSLSDPEFRDLGELDQVVFNKELTGGVLIPSQGGGLAPIVRWYLDGRESEKIGEVDIANFRKISRFRENSLLALQNDWLVWIKNGDRGILSVRNLPTGEQRDWSFPRAIISTVAPVTNSENEVFFVDSNGMVTVVDCANGQVVSTFSGISPE